MVVEAVIRQIEYIVVLDFTYTIIVFLLAASTTSRMHHA